MLGDAARGGREGEREGVNASLAAITTASTFQASSHFHPQGPTYEKS